MQANLNIESFQKCQNIYANSLQENYNPKLETYIWITNDPLWSNYGIIVLRRDVLQSLSYEEIKVNILICLHENIF